MNVVIFSIYGFSKGTLQIGGGQTANYPGEHGHVAIHG
jgi:hypothetical protein